MASDSAELPSGDGMPSPERDDAAWEMAAAACPDDLDLVTEVADMMAILSAQRLERVYALHLRARADVVRFGGAVAEIVDRSVRLELSAALRITEAAAGRLVATAVALSERYRAALGSLGCARMTERHAEFLAESLDAVEPALREELLPRAVDLAETLGVGSFRRALRNLIETARAATLEERHEAAVVRRRVVYEPAEDGMAWLHAYGPAVELQAIHGRLTATAKVLATREGEERTLDQLRSDVFGDLLIDGDTTALPPEARGIRATVAVTVPALALLDESADRCEPAVVEGIGPIPASHARELCGGADGWMRILTHPETGMVLSVGRTQYRPPAALRRLVRWRADRCMAPGCGMPASRCEIDHSIAWQHGGTTALGNLAPLCKGHHIVKHHGGWTVAQIDGSGGALLWTSPSGRRYVVQPERRVPVFRVSGGVRSSGAGSGGVRSSGAGSDGAGYGGAGSATAGVAPF